MVRQDAGGELANLMVRESELARAAERARRDRSAAGGRPDRRLGRLRAAAVSALGALIVRLDPAALIEPRLGRDGGG